MHLYGVFGRHKYSAPRLPSGVTARVGAANIQDDGYNGRKRRPLVQQTAGGRRRRTGNAAKAHAETAARAARRARTPGFRQFPASWRRDLRPEPTRGRAFQTRTTAPLREVLLLPRGVAWAGSPTGEIPQKISPHFAPRPSTLPRAIGLRYSAVELSGPGSFPVRVGRPFDTCNQLRCQLEALRRIEGEGALGKRMEVHRHV